MTPVAVNAVEAGMAWTVCCADADCTDLVFDTSMDPAETAYLASVHNDLHHGGNPVAGLATTGNPSPEDPLTHDAAGESDQDAPGPAARSRDGRGLTRTALVEDVWWMAQTGETVTGAATRLGIRAGSLRTALARAGRQDLARRLDANRDRPGAGVHHVTVQGNGRSGRIRADAYASTGTVETASGDLR